MVKPTCTQSSTISHTEHVSDTSSNSKYKGVRKRKWGKWVSEVRLPNSRERIWLGSFDSAEKAARAFDAALYCLRGRDAKFNFPENPPEIIAGRSLSPQEIQVVAARFANEVEEEETAGRTPVNNNNDTTTTNSSNNNNNYVGTEPYTSSSSVSVSAGGATAAIQVESLEMYWSSFLSMLDTDQAMSDYGFYSGLGHLPGDQLYLPPIPPPLIDDNVDDDQNGGDGFSQYSSFLWNF